MGRLSKACGLSDYYTNHCIRVTRITNFKKNRFTDSQIMAVSGHKSIQSLALYQRVSDDEKLMMGLKLTFSLHHPKKAQELAAINIMQDDENPEENVQEPPKKQMKEYHMKHQFKMQSQLCQVLNKLNHHSIHTLDPRNNNILPLESVLVPYEANQNEVHIAQEQQEVQSSSDFNFDLLQMITDAEDDEQLVMAATQVENQMCENKSTTSLKMALMSKRNSPRRPQVFQNCTFGSIGTLNIHIYKS